jgi:hypothetical protein
LQVGARVTLTDFRLEQVADLNRRYGSPLRRPAEVEQFHRLLNGHPYLVSRGLWELASYGLGIDAFLAQADRDEGSFGDHLQRMLAILMEDRTLSDAVRQVLRGGRCPTEESFHRLCKAGILAGDSLSEARPRCPLYAAYFERHLLRAGPGCEPPIARQLPPAARCRSRRSRGSLPPRPWPAGWMPASPRLRDEG